SDEISGPSVSSGSNGVGAGSGGNYSRPSQSPSQSAAGYYPSSANVMPSPQGGPYGSIPFSSERSPSGFGSMGMGGGAARPAPHSGPPGRG
ncbi:unnamed protein product, partial [Scytosiphon promiscuus]